MKKIVVAVVAVSAIVMSVFYLSRKPATQADRLASNASEALGQRAADEVAKLIGEKHNISVIEFDVPHDQAPTFESLIEYFDLNLKRHGITVVSTNLIPGGFNALVLGGGPSDSRWNEILDESKDVGAVVSFVGAPPASIGRSSGNNRPPVVIVDLFGVTKHIDFPSLIAGNVVTLALVPRSADEVANSTQNSSLFDKYYKIQRAP